eukprot:TRINITY_DN15476_c0_g1_i2.p1 TRINITY_DN15476_c0_g1~~TRINITY_DN15476_c0_g1_i2.p1  ORF type:complete len:441 (+),score=118.07 TRINITY_DN15476_c0_g1_i2:194-1516(+)
MAVLLETSLGDMVIDLKVDEAPEVCTNFVKLCKVKYYNNCLLFNVQKDFIVQTGDPTNTGKGGACVHAKLPSGKRFVKDEITQKLKHNVMGTVAMANTRPNENGSQFYITLRSKVESMDGKHTIFGVVSEGLDVLAKINEAMVDEKNVPYQNIRIWHTEILDDPFPDPDGLEAIIPPKSPDVVQDEVFKAVEDAEDEAELNERMAKALAKSQSTTLELLHDLPDADIAPPDNDLFIANLNPATQDGDLELIFSRFGSIKSCEIVRDWKTGDSLQYAFITFEAQRDCEEAYFKMNDCVVDDRRIVVNFSQSVAKLWNKHRTGGRISKDDIKLADATKGKGGRGKGRGKGGKDSAPLLASSEGPSRGGGRGGGDSKKGLVFDDRPGAGSRADARGGGRDARERSRSRSRERRDQGRRPRSRSRQRDRDRDRDRDAEKRRHRG